MKLTIEQENRIEDVRYTLNCGNQGVWGNPAASLDACIEVLKQVKRSVISTAEQYMADKEKR